MTGRKSHHIIKNIPIHEVITPQTELLVQLKVQRNKLGYNIYLTDTKSSPLFIGENQKV